MKVRTDKHKRRWVGYKKYSWKAPACRRGRESADESQANTEHRPYNDGRHGTIHSKKMWTFAKTVGVTESSTQTMPENE